MHQELLRAERDLRRVLRRQRERLVERVRVDRLGAAGHSGQGLNGHADDVVLGLLSRQRRAAGLRVEAQCLRLRVRRAEPLPHDLGPEPPRRAELRHLLEEVVVRVEEEREPLAELVRREPRVDGGLRVGDPVRERERELLDGGRARLADVVPRDRDRVPLRQPLVRVREEIRRQAHRGLGREDVVPARAVLLEDVVLGRPAQLLALDALPLGDELVQQEEQGRRRVDRHRRRDLAERDPVEEELHVHDRVDRDPGPPHLAHGARVVRVVAELRREVERDREAGLAPLEEIAEARVRLLCRRKARVLADRPRPPAVHVRVRAARERELARELELEVRDVLVGVDRLDLDPGVGLPAILGGRHVSQSTLRP